MKKLKYLFIFFIIFLVGCNNRLVTKEEFTDKATFDGYIIKEDKSGYESYNKVLDVYYAINRENTYDIQFLELSDSDYAHQFFLHNAKDINDNVVNGNEDNVYQKSTVYDNYELYHVENDSLYYLVIRSYKNIIYIKAPIGYINEIEEFLQDLELEY